MSDFNTLKSLYEDGYRCIYYDKLENNHTIYLKNFDNENSTVIELEDENESFNYDFHEIVDIRVKIKTKDGCKWVWLRSNPIKNEKDEFVSSYIILINKI